uniref:ATP synthase F0 subunit 8 n=1 Tax=Agrius convolvuli TaxID=55055 RepID=UPI002205B2CA|nr:ATP synthase F0 subunit 8 [Agrius convolvuli]UXR12417.1 ATP synthase F0 subunit 8 [Agrius convolvuli]WMQ52812.1 ATP synthase F0 subunit 8 [Agrius convolvuli]
MPQMMPINWIFSLFFFIFIFILFNIFNYYIYFYSNYYSKNNMKITPKNNIFWKW